MRLHNPVLRRNATEYIWLDTGLCQACWKCVESCPNSVIGKIDLWFHKHAHIDHAERCKGCGQCVRSCPQKALTFHYKITR